MRRTVRAIAAMAAMLVSLVAQTLAQAPSKSGAPAMRVESDLRQLMRAILYPASNVVFSAQGDNPTDAKAVPGQDPSMATDPLVSTFGGWQAVENASLALAESANLLLIPGRTCANGVAVPMQDPDWTKFVQELRDASAMAYRAARSKDQDKMIEVAEVMSGACAHCHRKWREKAAAERCK
jgi:cytochrome c556